MAKRMSDGWELVMWVFIFFTSIRCIQLQNEANQLNKSGTDEKTTSKYKDGDWMVQLKKPKREIIISGCNTESEVCKEILIRGHRPEEIKDIIRL